MNLPVFLVFLNFFKLFFGKLHSCMQFFGIFGGISERCFNAFQTEVIRIEKTLSPRERLFCGYYAETGDAESSAKRAGFRQNSAAVSARLLCSEPILAEIERQLTMRRRIAPRLADIGYRRLAFGSISDALTLLFMESPTPDALARMDLGMISEIKRNKDGMLEIRFFDRLKALEKLGEHADDGSGLRELYDAIGRGADGQGEARD